MLLFELNILIYLHVFSAGMVEELGNANPLSSNGYQERSFWWRIRDMVSWWYEIVRNISQFPNILQPTHMYFMYLKAYFLLQTI